MPLPPAPGVRSITLMWPVAFSSVLAVALLGGALYLALVASLPSIAIGYFGFSQATAGAIGGQ